MTRIISALKRSRPWRNSARRASDLPAAERRAEASANRFKHLEIASALVVLVGIVGEYVPPFISSFPKVGFWVALWWVWAGAAIAVGIAGEILFSMLASGREKKVSSISAQRRTEAEQKTAELLQEVANANRLLEEEQRERIELERAIAPRTIRFGAALEPLRQFRDVHVLIHTVPDYEARRTAMSLYQAFAQAGWTLDRLTTEDGIADGVSIFVKMNPRARDLGAAVTQYLGHIQSIVFESDSGLFDLQVSVGFKPSYPDMPAKVFTAKNLPQ